MLLRPGALRNYAACHRIVRVCRMPHATILTPVCKCMMQNLPWLIHIGTLFVISNVQETIRIISLGISCQHLQGNLFDSTWRQQPQLKWILWKKLLKWHSKAPPQEHQYHPVSFSLILSHSHPHSLLSQDFMKLSPSDQLCAHFTRPQGFGKPSNAPSLALSSWRLPGTERPPSATRKSHRAMTSLREGRRSVFIPLSSKAGAERFWCDRTPK